MTNIKDWHSTNSPLINKTAVLKILKFSKLPTIV